MTITQVYDFVNKAYMQATGQSALLQEDLSNVVDVGNSIFNYEAVDKYVRSLMIHIGRVIFVDRVYRGSVPSVLRDAWEFGAALEKIQMDTPKAQENETWELYDGQVVEQDIFYKPVVTAKFFSKQTTFEVPMSIGERQVKMSFSNATQLNAFVSMIYNTIEKAMTIFVDELTMRTINNFAAETIYDDYGGNSLSASSGVKAINLLYLYNTAYGTSLTAAAALKTPDFIRFASYQIRLTMARLSRVSSLFNIEKKDRFTPSDMLHFVTLADFQTAAETYLYGGAGQFRVDDIKLPKAEVVPYWQGEGTDYAFSTVSKLYVTTASGHSVEASGIIAVMFDHDALGVTNYNRRVPTHRNERGEFVNNFFKADAGYFNDFQENFVVFFIA